MLQAAVASKLPLDLVTPESRRGCGALLQPGPGGGGGHIGFIYQICVLNDV